MTGTTLCVEKRSDTMRATFVAVGLARLIATLVDDRPDPDVWIRDGGSIYRIETVATKVEIVDAVREKGLPQLLPAILKPLTPNQKKQLDQGTPLEHLQQRYVPAGFPSANIVDYDSARTSWRAKFKLVQNTSDNALPFDSRAPLWAHLCSHFSKGVNMQRTYPLLVHIWFAHKREWAVRLCEFVLDSFSNLPNQPLGQLWLKQIKPHLDGSSFDQFNWAQSSAQVKALSLVSPTTISGSNTVRAGQRLTNDTLSLFWLEMYLAYAGWLSIALPCYWQKSRGSRKDVATYYPLPCNLTFAHLHNIMHHVRNDPDIWSLYDWGPGLPRVYTEVWNTLLFFRGVQSSASSETKDEAALTGLKGLASCYYKDISANVPLEENVFATILPHDTPHPLQSGDRWESLITAVQAVVGKPADLRNVPSDTQAIADHLRAYLLAPTAENWTAFSLAYAQYCYHHMRATRYPLTLTQASWEQHLMGQTNSNYAEILEDTGFQAIAAAIHYATTGLLWRTQNPQNPRPSMFKVRYGLDLDLLDQARQPDRFIAAVSEFLRSYAWERERLRVNNVHGEHWPPEVTDEHLYRLVALIDQHGSELIARLLVTSGLLRH